MKKYIIFNCILIIVSLLVACGDASEKTVKESESSSADGKNESKEDTQIPENIWYDADYNKGIVQDTAHFVVDTFGYKSNVSADIKDGQHTVGLEEIEGNLTRFYSSTNAIEVKDTGKGKGLELTLIGEIEKDYDSTYLSSMDRTKQILDYVYSYEDEDIDYVDISWYYPYKVAAGNEGFTLYPIYKDVFDRDEYEESWKDLDMNQMSIDKLADLNHMFIPNATVLIPFTENMERHDKVGKEYDMNGLKATLLGIDYVTEVNGETAQEYCGDDRECSKFVQVEIKVKNDRDYPMKIDAKNYINVWKFDEDEDFPMNQHDSEGVYRHDVKGVTTTEKLQPGEEVVLNPFITWQDDGDEHTGISFTTEYPNHLSEVDKGDISPVDEAYMLSWLIEDAEK